MRRVAWVGVGMAAGLGLSPVLADEPPSVPLPCPEAVSAFLSRQNQCLTAGLADPRLSASERWIDFACDDLEADRATLLDEYHDDPSVLPWLDRSNFVKIVQRVPMTPRIASPEP